MRPYCAVLPGEGAKMWEISGWLAWIASGVIFFALIFDFLSENIKHGGKIFTAQHDDELYDKSGE